MWSVPVGLILFFQILAKIMLMFSFEFSGFRVLSAWRTIGFVHFIYFPQTGALLIGEIVF